MRKRSQARLEEMIVSAYVDWRDVCRLVDDADRAWVSETGPGAAVAFRRYTAALDAEERAAEVYASLVGGNERSTRASQMRTRPDVADTLARRPSSMG
jgi:hypothetical protein